MKTVSPPRLHRQGPHLFVGEDHPLGALVDCVHLTSSVGHTLGYPGVLHAAVPLSGTALGRIRQCG
jgi:hypothetical protein